MKDRRIVISPVQQHMIARPGEFLRLLNATQRLFARAVAGIGFALGFAGHDVQGTHRPAVVGQGPRGEFHFTGGRATIGVLKRQTSDVFRAGPQEQHASGEHVVRPIGGQPFLVPTEIINSEQRTASCQFVSSLRRYATRHVAL